MEGLLAPKLVEVITGKAEVRQIFKTSKTAAISGSYVSEGKITRGNIIRVLRSMKLYKGKIDSLRRFKEDVKEVTTGYECGIQITDFQICSLEI